MDSELDRFDAAYGASFEFHDENLGMLAWYAERMLASLERAQVRSLMSLGIGHRIVAQRILAAVGRWLDSYTIVEGSPLRIHEFERANALPPRVRLVESYFERFEPTELVDAVEMGFVLEHVDDPELLVRRFSGFVRPGGIVVVVVPNARALHRELGHLAGLLEDPYRLSPHDLALGHQRYFDFASIKGLVESCGLRVTRSEGVFLKCLTTAQLRSLRLPGDVLRAFYEVGVRYPEVANAIYLEAVV